VNGEAFIGLRSGGSGTLNLTNSTVTFKDNGYVNIGRERAVGVLNMAGSSTMTAVGEFRIGCWGGTGSATLSDTTSSPYRAAP